MGTLATWQLGVKGIMASLLKSSNNEGEREEENKPKPMPVIELYRIPSGYGDICLAFYKGLL